jgi:hypothetical protein
MTPESREGAGREATQKTSIARQQLAKRVSAVTDKHENHRGAAGNGDIYSVCPCESYEATKSEVSNLRQ